MHEDKWPRKMAGLGKDGLTTFEVNLIICDYQLLWQILLHEEMQSNHPGMLQSPTLTFEERKSVKLDSSSIVLGWLSVCNTKLN